jgi:hypothetical protein
VDKNLQKYLVSLAKEDQELLEKLSKSGDLANYKDEVHPELKIVFERNTRKAKEIIKKHGWPKISLVGEVGADAIYHIVQHSVLDEAFMQACVPLLEERVKQQEAKGYQLAFLQDRTLMQQKKPQIYGTQHIEDNNGKRGVAIFAKACFGHPSPSKRQKLNATTNAFGAPDVLRTCHFATPS